MLRHAKKEDGPEVSRLLYDAIHDIAHQLTGQETEADALDVLEKFFVQEEGRLSYHQMLVKEVNGEVAGVVVSYAGSDAAILDKPIIDYLRNLKNDPNIVLDKEADEDEYYIDTLSVSPAYGRRGIGTELMIAVENEATNRNFTRIALAVDIDNAGAYALYQRSGFIVDKEIPINGHMYYHMVKTISL
ncbi:GNAT family N-acetyltransferase [Paenibacillus macquariensis]|uniref:Acetyltransferase (GNAT) family protein n=1 Tax=Paenibacillus macquariensis TaxID=948756 RepID=A0ABY1JZ76_9BACL|nr:GNAT family N-acetyltransferase [Paenibacillus macquariensis]MEC0091259.1 GNAT family N-acetyltransferase [Paenibacillus macquariensis]OAB37953.1 GCN5 family acetyltransferase [Paenibacillus macquariensis subsp. macquariensis]SIR03018.1 Acetyltransferase (GNAT) family protein [Paenibacillus macquariensis]